MVLKLCGKLRLLQAVAQVHRARRVAGAEDAVDNAVLDPYQAEGGRRRGVQG